MSVRTVFSQTLIVAAMFETAPEQIRASYVRVRVMEQVFIVSLRELY